MLIARAPLRIGLAGGGSDVPPFCDEEGGNVINATIDKFVFAFLEENDKKEILFVNQDLEKFNKYNLDQIKEIDSKKSLIEGVYSYFCKKYNNGKLIALRIETYCEIPFGSGLGTSSTIVVALCELLNNFFNAKLSRYELAKIAYQIERENLGLDGGYQDHFSAAFGGINMLSIGPKNQFNVENLEIKKETLLQLESSTLLAYSGLSRQSEKIINDQKLVYKKDSSISALRNIKNEAIKMKEIILKNDFASLFKTINYGWEQKKKTSQLVSNHYLDNLINSCFEFDAKACKVSGAGGGGFLIIMIDPQKKYKLMKFLKKKDIFMLNFTFVNQGCISWNV